MSKVIIVLSAANILMILICILIHIYARKIKDELLEVKAQLNNIKEVNDEFNEITQETQQNLEQLNSGSIDDRINAAHNLLRNNKSNK